MKQFSLVIMVLTIATISQAQTWSQLQVPNTRNLYGCWFDSSHPDTGMAVGWYIQNFDRLPFGFYTTDGGATISAGSLFQIYFYASSDVWFTNSYSGVVVGNGIIQTTNGGANWNLIVDAASTQAGILENIMFTNTTDGYAVGQRYDFNYTSFEGMLYRTKNAGGSWIDFTVSQEVNNENTLLHAVYSTGNGVIYAGAENLLGGSTLFKSINDGTSWLSLSFSQTIWSLFFTSTDTGFAATANGLYKTTNAGISWTNILTTANALHTIQIKNGFGIAAGDNGIIYSTSDNGNTWTSMISPVTTTITDVSVISPNLAYAVGVSGTFLKYTNSVGMEELNHSDDISCWLNSNQQLIINWKNDIQNPISIDILNVNGTVIKKIANGRTSGRHSIEIDLSSFSNGVYFIRFDELVTKKIVVIK